MLKILKGTLPNLFYDPILKSDKDRTRKESYPPIYLILNTSEQNSAAH